MIGAGIEIYNIPLKIMIKSKNIIYTFRKPQLSTNCGFLYDIIPAVVFD